MHDTIIVQQEMEAPGSKVWEAITNKEQMEHWYYDIPDFALELHQPYSFYRPGDLDKKYHHQIEIVEVIPEKKLKYSWSYPEITKNKSMVKWELEENGNKTIVTLTHKGIENFEHFGPDFSHEFYEKEWTKDLQEALKNFVEQ